MFFTFIYNCMGNRALKNTRSGLGQLHSSLLSDLRANGCFAGAGSITASEAAMFPRSLVVSLQCSEYLHFLNLQRKGLLPPYTLPVSVPLT